MTHPIKPLNSQETRDLQASLVRHGTMAEVNACMMRYDRYRDLEFPDWRNLFTAQMQLWFAHHGQEFPKCCE